ncbi:hypothetical protein [Aquisphaera insulae]|uniref:hypothetical protein n=1 Tax=Aquisphaera insulae TaxID=2712864 RepID=UPI0013ED15FF|nr:hypothetical protein [Aquisphaera insulae]
MDILLIPSLMALLIWANVAIVRMFRSRDVPGRWRIVLSIAWLVGAGLGVWGGFCFEYQPASKLRVIGAPVPTAFFVLEGPPGEEHWIDYITPVPTLLASSNVVILSLLAGCLVGLVFRLSRRGATRPTPGWRLPAER